MYYFPFRPADNITATWTAIEHCDVKNGCLFVSPGSHRLNKLYAHGYPKNSIVNKFYHGIQVRIQFILNYFVSKFIYLIVTRIYQAQ